MNLNLKTQNYGVSSIKILILCCLALVCAGKAFAQHQDYSQGTTQAQLELVENVIQIPGHPDRPWLNAVSSRVVSVLNKGSGTIVYKNEGGQGVLWTAQHVLKRRPPGRSEDATPYMETPRVMDLFVDEKSGAGDLSKIVERFGYLLYAPGFSAEEYDWKIQKEGHFQKLQPKNDFAIGVVTGSTYQPYAGEQGKTWEDRLKFDPTPLEKVAGKEINFEGPFKLVSPVDGERAIAIGFPQTSYGQKAYSIGKIITGEEAVRINRLFGENVDATLPLDPQAEFIVAGKATFGMSGGGVFDSKGQYLGVIVRGGELPNGEAYMRVVRAEYVSRKWQQQLASAQPLLKRSLLKLTKDQFLDSLRMCRDVLL